MTKSKTQRRSKKPPRKIFQFVETEVGNTNEEIADAVIRLAERIRKGDFSKVSDVDVVICSDAQPFLRLKSIGPPDARRTIACGIGRLFMASVGECLG